MNKLNMFGFLCLLYLFYCASCCEEALFPNGEPIVETPSGTVLGKNIKIFDTKVTAFLGIPYAVPPLGEKRFMKPEPIKPWEGVIKAYEYPRPCMQYSTKSMNLSFPISYLTPQALPSEDCLYLNIWSKCCCNTKRKSPVLVSIYGGGFSSGSSDIPLHDGTTLAAKGDVVVVTFNYRVGSFGFLYGGIDEAPGNAGMHDQVLALKWVQDNIQAFGGDPNSVTLVGESAGAISISLHIISPLSRGLFHRAILQSGSSYGVPIIDNPSMARLKAERLAVVSGCNISTHFSMVIDCMKKMDPLEIAKLEFHMMKEFPVLFAPIFNEEFLPKSPKEAYNSGDMAQVEVLAGLAQNEGSLFLHFVMPHMFSFDSEPTLNLETAWGTFKEMYKLIPRLVVYILWEFYFMGISDQDSPAIVAAIRESYGDCIFACPVLFLMEKLDNGYMYWMTHRSTKNPLPKWVGTTHSDDVPYVFGVPIHDTEHFTEEDGKFSEDIIRMWVLFARTGHPLYQNLDSWPKFKSSDPIVYELNPRKYKSMPFPRKVYCRFWRVLLLF